MTERVSVVGLGKLGLGLALSFAKAGLRTVGVDVRPEHVAELQRGRSPIVEPGYQETLSTVGASFTATTDMEDAIRETDVTFILTGTPSDASGRFSSRDVEAAAREAGRALRQIGKAHHLFVISSTLTPGTTERRVIPAIEETSGRRLNRGFAVCYDPDFVALGSVMHDFANPEVVVIGESSPEAGQRVAALHARIVQSRPAMSRMSIVSAEVAKVSLNAFITLKIAFANTVGNLCEAIPGADVDQIARAIGADRRISPHYFKGGLPFGGTCFPRDTHAFRAVCEEHGEDSSLMGAVAASNEWQHARLAATALSLAGPGARVAVLGLAFKGGTPVIEASAGARLAQALVQAGRAVTVYDRLAPIETQQALADGVHVARTAEEAMSGASVVVVTLTEPEYLKAVDSWRPGAPATVLDCWRALDGRTLDGLITRVAMGRGVKPADSGAMAA